MEFEGFDEFGFEVSEHLEPFELVEPSALVQRVDVERVANRDEHVLAAVHHVRLRRV